MNITNFFRKKTTNSKDIELSSVVQIFYFSLLIGLENTLLLLELRQLCPARRYHIPMANSKYGQRYFIIISQLAWKSIRKSSNQLFIYSLLVLITPFTNFLPISICRLKKNHNISYSFEYFPVFHGHYNYCGRYLNSNLILKPH